jgi:hypothetical protein
MKTLYRYEDDPPIYNRPPSFTLYIYKVERETKYCYFVRKVGICSFISFKLRKMFKSAKRPFAHETIEEAQQAYIRRKFRHIEHTRRAYNKAQALFNSAKKEFNMEKSPPPDKWFDDVHN